MDDAKIKHVAVRGDILMILIILSIIFIAGNTIYQNHKWGDIERDLKDEIRDLEADVKVLEGDVGWNEDQLVNMNKWKDKVYQEKIIGGKN